MLLLLLIFAAANPAVFSRQNLTANSTNAFPGPPVVKHFPTESVTHSSTNTTKLTGKSTTVSSFPSSISLGNHIPFIDANATKISPESLAKIQKICVHGNCLKQSNESLQRRSIVKQIHLQLLKWKSSTRHFTSVQANLAAEKVMKMTYMLKKGFLRAAGIPKSLVFPADDGLISGSILMNEIGIQHLLAKMISNSALDFGSEKEDKNNERAVFVDPIYQPLFWISPLQFHITSDLSKSVADEVRKSIKEISTQVSCLKFLEKEGKIQDHEYSNVIIFTKMPENSTEDQCVFSTIVRLPPHPNAIFLNPKCKNLKKWILFGLLQVLGVTHQFNRLDRDQYLSINWENISPEMFDVFLIDPKDFTSSYGTPFDVESIHFFPSTFGSKAAGLITISPKNSSVDFNSSTFGSKEVLSCGDVEVLKKLFCCPNCRDVDSSCGHFSNLGFCSSKSSWFWMKSNCAKSCAQGIQLDEKCPKHEFSSHFSPCICPDSSISPPKIDQEIGEIRANFDDFKRKHIVSALPCTGLPCSTNDWFDFLQKRGVSVDKVKGLPQRYTFILHANPEIVKNSFTIPVKGNLFKTDQKFAVFDLRFSNKDKKYLVYRGLSCVIAGVVNKEPVHLQGLCDSNLTLA